jgi:hypothetical protein
LLTEVAAGFNPQYFILNQFLISDGEILTFAIGMLGAGYWISIRFGKMVE